MLSHGPTVSVTSCECDLEKQEAASMLEAALRYVSSAGLRSPHGHLFRNRWSTACWDILCEGKNR